MRSQKMNDLISVILPIYNVEKYLRKCVDSLLKQTYKNLEIILVDDGSPDNCPLICDELAKIDSRVKVLHKKNGGLSDARNYGLDHCNGNYVVFVDSDDFVNINMIDYLYKAIKNQNADIAICNFRNVYENELINYEINEPMKDVKLFKDEQIINNLFNDLQLIFTVAWNKLYKREIFNNIRYKKGKLHEDEFAIHYILNNCKKVVFVNQELYYYVQRQGSIMDSYDLRRLDCIEAYHDRAIFFKNTLFYEKTVRSLLNLITINYYYVQKYYPERSDILQSLDNTFKNFYFKSKEFTIKDRIKYFIFLNSKHFFCKLMRFY